MSQAYKDNKHQNCDTLVDLHRQCSSCMYKNTGYKDSDVLNCIAYPSGPYQEVCPDYQSPEDYNEESEKAYEALLNFRSECLDCIYKNNKDADVLNCAIHPSGPGQQDCPDFQKS